MSEDPNLRNKRELLDPPPSLGRKGFLKHRNPEHASPTPYTVP